MSPLSERRYTCHIVGLGESVGGAGAIVGVGVGVGGTGVGVGVGGEGSILSAIVHAPQSLADPT